MSKRMRRSWPARSGLLAVVVGTGQPALGQEVPLPIETSLIGIFQAIGPVRWGILLLSVMLVSIAVSGLVFLCLPLARRRELASSLSSLKEWNTVLSTLCTILGPVGTYIGMIGALLAMHQVAVAVDATARLAAQAAFFQKAAQMFVSSLAGIGIGMSLGLVNSLALHHVLPDHEYPIEREGMLAATVGILQRWWRRRKVAPLSEVVRDVAPRPALLPGSGIEGE